MFVGKRRLQHILYGAYKADIRQTPRPDHSACIIGDGCHHIGRCCRPVQEPQGPLLPHVQAEFLQTVDYLGIAASLGIQDQVCECHIEQFTLLTAFNRFEARHQSRFFGKAAEQRLAEAMDGQYLQPAAGCVQYLCKHLPRLFAGLWTSLCTNSLKIMEQDFVVQLDP